MARQFTWIPPAGEPIVLNDEAAGYRLKAAGTRGLSAPPYRMSRSVYAGTPGSHLDAIQPDEREVSLGLQVQALTEAEFRARWRAMVRAFRPLAGDGELRVTDEFGVTRSLYCRYSGGLEGDAEAEFSGREGRAVVKLAAFDPWWYGDPVDLPFLLGPPPSFFPIFPLRFAPTEIAGAIPVDNVGDEDAFAVWRVDGPGNGLLLANDTTGKSLELSTVLPAGRFLTIDTRPFFQSVLLDDGTNLFGDLMSDPAMWVLAPGTNAVSVMLSGASGASRVTGSYRPRYAGIA